ncbi:c-type cytochrome [Chitinivorax sp. B]|uniref:c-type cytochrome n=1 Tax=Chitinivorax sp. B TaxID=2502235 RepID=UPI0010F4B93A|nr:c-type cytochrome [Chitinivorax sp. B]
MRAAIAILAALVGFVSGHAMAADAKDAKVLVQKYNCLSCHTADKKVVGPSYKEVATKYKGDKTAEAKLIAKVKAGGGGVWGPVPMPPNPTVPDADLKTMVQWILATK